MFTSNSNNISCDNHMVVEDEQTMFDNRPFENDISPNYKPDNLSFSFFHFSPATFFDQDDAFFQSVAVDSPADSITTTMAATEEDHQTQTTKMEATAASMDNDPSKMNLPANSKTKASTNSSASARKIPKRSRVAGKKDRHSKIVTAQGPRDRRMRLSLPIAKEFFSLQDMLGVDKPSKTVQWLLTMSKSAIEQLTISLSHRRRIHNKCHTSTTTGSSMSECEAVSEIVETVVAYEEEAHDRRSSDFSKRKSMESSISTSNKGKKIKRSRKITYNPIARESRAKARARARERTLKKMHNQRITDKSKQCVEENLSNDLRKVRSLTSTSKKCEESAGSGTYDMKSTFQLVSTTDEIMKHSSLSTEQQVGHMKDNTINDLEESFMITTRKPSLSSILSYNDDIGLTSSNNNNNNNNKNSTSVLNFSEIWDFANNAGQTNSSYCGITNMNLPAGNYIQEYCLPSSSSISLASQNTHLQSQFANFPLFRGKP